MIRSAGAGLLVFLFFQSCKTHLSTYSSDNKKIDQSVSDHAIDSIAMPYRSAMHKQMAEVIGYADSSLISFAPESPLGNFAADVVFESGFEYTKSNTICSDLNDIFCLLNFGGLRTSINKGEITLGDIYELMPFDNSIVILKITRDSLFKMLHYLLDVKGQPVSNIRMELSSDSKAVSVGPEGEGSTEFVYVITSDYLANGGDKMNFLQNPMGRWDTGILIRDALISYIQRTKTIPYFPIENRIVIN